MKSNFSTKSGKLHLNFGRRVKLANVNSNEYSTTKKLQFIRNASSFCICMLLKANVCVYVWISWKSVWDWLHFYPIVHVCYCYSHLTVCYVYFFLLFVLNEVSVLNFDKWMRFIFHSWNVCVCVIEQLGSCIAGLDRIWSGSNDHQMRLELNYVYVEDSTKFF